MTERISDERLADCIEVARQDVERYAAHAHGRTRIKADTFAALAAAQQQPAEGEEIMVNTPYDVFILPLRPSGLDGKGPRFVVHVPGPKAQPAEQQDESEDKR